MYDDLVVWFLAPVREREWVSSTSRPHTGEEIDDQRQIQPALPGADISNIGDPDLAGPDTGELPCTRLAATTEGLPALRRGAL